MLKRVRWFRVAMTLCITMALIFAMGTAAFAAEIENNGYPYGMNMGSYEIKLVIEVEGADENTKYEWQFANKEDSTSWTTLTVKVGDNSVLFEPTNNVWYRCKVDGVASKAVQAIQVGATGENCYPFTRAENNRWYLSNGSMAYTTYDKYFDIVGKYTVPNSSDTYWVNTSFKSSNNFWQTGAAEDPSKTAAYDNDNVDKITLYFDATDSQTVLVDMKLGDDCNAAVFGTDTMLGNSDVNSYFKYDDSASLKAVFENGAFTKVQMVGAKSVDEADRDTVSFVITPKTPNAIFWIGSYYQDYNGEAYGYNEGDSSYNIYYTFGTQGTTDYDNYVTEIQGYDSSLAISWKNLTYGATVQFTVSVGTAAQTGANISGSAIDIATGNVDLTLDSAATSIEVKVDGTTLTKDVHYTITGEDTTSPKITFLPAAGLTSESNIVVMVDGSSITITNNIPPESTTTTTKPECRPEIHRCDSQCDVCGACTDEDCTEYVCREKCVLLGMDFDDVRAGQWYTDAVEYVYHRNLMDGIGNDLFGTDNTMTRAMLVTILYRLEGEPVVGGTQSFDDVARNTWYTYAVKWAADNGIVLGYGDVFKPMDNITREQLAAILYRYAQYKGYDMTAGENTNILSYTDALSISEYAMPAMQWACGEGILTGNNGMLNPQGFATRSEAAAMLMRFCENVAE